MKTFPHKTERLHSLDSLRAIMMLLGLVIHSSITYGAVNYGGAWFLKDPGTTHVSNDFIVFFIHAFRMQIFFMVAGFFGAMLFYERSPIKMIKNRISRVVLPFIVFVLLLYPSIKFGIAYTNLIFQGGPNAFMEALATLSSWDTLIPSSTFHLWFLYYLALITFVSAGLAFFFQKMNKISAAISATFNWLIVRPVLRVLFFGVMTAMVYYIMGTTSLATPFSFVPDVNAFIYYFSFSIVGWVLFKSKHQLDQMMKADWLCVILAISLFSINFFFPGFFNFFGLIAIKSLTVWLFIFGFTGLFIRYASNHSALMRYVSDASYWVYLVHLSIVVLIPSFIVNWPIPPTLKFLTVLSLTGLICFVSYHYLVRTTFIGKFLNGRKYSRKLSDIKKQEELSGQKMALG
jgi:glucans biosynthesis protein C